MQIELEMAPGLFFVTTTAQVGLSEKGAREFRDSRFITHQTAMVWNQVRQQGERLMALEPAGRA